MQKQRQLWKGTRERKVKRKKVNIWYVHKYHIQVKTPQRNNNIFSFIFKAHVYIKICLTSTCSWWLSFQKSDLYNRNDHYLSRICTFIVRKHIICTGFKNVFFCNDSNWKYENLLFLNMEIHSFLGWKKIWGNHIWIV